MPHGILVLAALSHHQVMSVQVGAPAYGNSAANILDGETVGPAYGTMLPGAHGAQGVDDRPRAATQGLDLGGGAGVAGMVDGREAVTGTGARGRDEQAGVANAITGLEANGQQPGTAICGRNGDGMAGAMGTGRFQPDDGLEGDLRRSQILNFSPPEELSGRSNLGGSVSPTATATVRETVWLTRLGEFLHRRVSQASAIMSPMLDTSRHQLEAPRVPSSWVDGGGQQPTPLFGREQVQAMSQWPEQAPLLHPRPGGGFAGHSSSDSGSISPEVMQAEVQRQVQRAMERRDLELQELRRENQRLQGLAQRALEQGVPQGPAEPPGNPVVQPGPLQEPRHLPVQEQLPEPGPSQEPLHAQLPRPSGVPRLVGGVLGALGGRPRDPAETQGNPVVQPGPLRDPAGDGYPSQGPANRQGEPTSTGGGRPGANPMGPSAQAASMPSQGDPLLVLVQGMSQLQQAMAMQITSEKTKPETVKPGIAASELAKLPEMGETAALDVGDWLHALSGPMGDLSDTSGTWWQGIMDALEHYYEAFLKANAVQKVGLNVMDFVNPEIASAKWARVDKRASGMVLQAVPESVKREVMANRLSSTAEVLARIVTLYRPGSSVERQQILKALAEPMVASSPLEAVDGLRRWARWLKSAPLTWDYKHRIQAFFSAVLMGL